MFCLSRLFYEYEYMVNVPDEMDHLYAICVTFNLLTVVMSAINYVFMI